MTVYNGTAASDFVTVDSQTSTYVLRGDNDTLLGSLIDEQDIIVYAGSGDDFVTANYRGFSSSDASALIFGGAGNDTLLGSNGDDTIFGGNNDDSIYGTEGNDVLLTGTGQDRVIGNDGVNLIVLDEGVDTLQPLSVDQATDYVFGFSSEDLIDLTAFQSEDVTFDNSNGIASVSVDETPIYYLIGSEVTDGQLVFADSPVV